MKENRNLLYKGIGLLAAFFVVLACIFMPLWGNNENTLNYLDNLFNSISKGSAYYIPDIIKQNNSFMNHPVQLEITMKSEKQAEQTIKLLTESGATVQQSGLVLNISGDLGKIVSICLKDADEMFHNKGDGISGKYGYAEQLALFNWWTALDRMDYMLTKAKNFDDANFLKTVKQKALEPAYNYYKIDAQNVSDKIGVVLFSLIFYVIYTLWFGFSIMFLFEGSGMRLGH